MALGTVFSVVEDSCYAYCPSDYLLSCRRLSACGDTKSGCYCCSSSGNYHHIRRRHLIGTSGSYVGAVVAGSAAPVGVAGTAWEAAAADYDDDVDAAVGGGVAGGGGCAAVAAAVVAAAGARAASPSPVVGTGSETGCTTPVTKHSSGCHRPTSRHPRRLLSCGVCVPSPCVST